MRTIKITLDDRAADVVDKVIKKLHTTRSAFTRSAPRDALKKVQLRQQEQKHRKGYGRNPVKEGEFSFWEDEQVSGDE